MRKTPQNVWVWTNEWSKQLNINKIEVKTKPKSKRQYEDNRRSIVSLSQQIHVLCSPDTESPMATKSETMPRVFAAKKWERKKEMGECNITSCILKCSTTSDSINSGVSHHHTKHQGKWNTANISTHFQNILKWAEQTAATLKWNSLKWSLVSFGLVYMRVPSTCLKLKWSETETEFQHFFYVQFLCDAKFRTFKWRKHVIIAVYDVIYYCFGKYESAPCTEVAINVFWS